MSDPESGISCDICINNLLAVANTKLLKDYAQIDQRLLQLAFLVKHWAKQRGVNETYRGTLSSYACVKIDDIHYTRISLFLSPPCSFLSLQIWVLIFVFFLHEPTGMFLCASTSCSNASQRFYHACRFFSTQLYGIHYFTSSPIQNIYSN
jgi:hypothetical protein